MRNNMENSDLHINTGLGLFDVSDMVNYDPDFGAEDTSLLDILVDIATSFFSSIDTSESQSTSTPSIIIQQKEQEKGDVSKTAHTITESIPIPVLSNLETLDGSDSAENDQQALPETDEIANLPPTASSTQMGKAAEIQADMADIKATPLPAKDKDLQAKEDIRNTAQKVINTIKNPRNKNLAEQELVNLKDYTPLPKYKMTLQTIHLLATRGAN